eukprot:tig00021126_g18464.t1
MPPQIEVLELRPGFRQFHGMYAGITSLVFTPTGPGPHPVLLFLEDAREDAALPDIAVLAPRALPSFIELPAMPFDPWPFCVLTPSYKLYSRDDCSGVVPFLQAFQRDIAGSDKKVDESRIYVTGVGAGAAHALQLALDHPNFFAAVCAVSDAVPMALAVKPGNLPSSHPEQCPVWYIVATNERDKAQKAEAVRRALESAGFGDVRVSSCELGMPSAGERAYAAGSDVYPWLLASVRRSDANSRAGTGAMAGAAAGPSRSRTSTSSGHHVMSPASGGTALAHV